MNHEKAWARLKLDIEVEIEYLQAIIHAERAKTATLETVTNITNWNIKIDALRQIQKHMEVTEGAFIE